MVKTNPSHTHGPWIYHGKKKFSPSHTDGGFTIIKDVSEIHTGILVLQWCKIYHTHTHIFELLQIHVHTSTHTHIKMSASHKRIPLCTHTHTHIYTHTHTHTHTHGVGYWKAGASLFRRRNRRFRKLSF